MVKTTNLLNLVAIALVLFSFVNIISLGMLFSFIPVVSILALAILSLELSRREHTRFSFLLFTLYVNLSIFYFCKHHPQQTDNYLYYFPVIVSVVLLNNPRLSDRFSLVHLGICALFFTATFTVDIPGMRQELAPEMIRSLKNFNLAASFSITVVLSLLLTHLISGQNDEIVQQNNSLLKAKEVVKASLREKEVLLAELHHRVKNNLAIISGLLNLQDDATTNEEAKDIIGESKTRIMSMALVHRMLYENSELKRLDLARYTSELVNELFNSYNLSNRVNVHTHFEKVELPISKCIPLGLIINELVTNSIKYVFRKKGPEKGNFTITIFQKDNLVSIQVRDDGPGFPQGFNAEAENLSLGIYLVKTLTEQIDGTVRFSNEDGARIDLAFPAT